MKLNKVIILVILLVLIYFNGLAQAKMTSRPLRASNSIDSVEYVTLPIDLIRQANKRLIERKYLIAIYYEQDSIINYKDSYIKYQADIIDNMQHRIEQNAWLNQRLHESVEKQKKTNRILICGAAGVVAGLVVGILVK